MVDRKSTSGFFVSLNNVADSWGSRKPSEAEDISLSQCGKDIHWVRQLLHKIGMNCSGPPSLFEDNTGAIIWAKHLRHTKNIELKYHFIGELVKKQVSNM